jgi:hypothetical protein
MDAGEIRDRIRHARCGWRAAATGALTPTLPTRVFTELVGEPIMQRLSPKRNAEAPETAFK